MDIHKMYTHRGVHTDAIQSTEQTHVFRTDLDDV